VRKLGPLCLVLLAGCAGSLDVSQPLSSTKIREQLIGRTFTGLTGDQRFFVTFNGNGSATYQGADAQFVQWRADDRGLCIRWYDEGAEKCAPVFVVGNTSYRIGSITINQIDIPHRF
jgi:hypothetical protein